MPDEKHGRDHSFPPPPMDPFPTYQTLYPRTNKDDEQNPFIQFRRFADEQVSSLFSGFPHFFGLSSSGTGASGDHWKKEVEDIMRQRHEWEEGFHKQFEQEMEEMRQQLEKSKNEAWKSMEDTWRQHSSANENNDVDTTPAPWWTKGKAARCPALNGQQLQKNADKCPALYDEQGQPRTELDAYDALQRNESEKQVQVFQAPVQETLKSPARSWYSALGWDGIQKEKLSSNPTTSEAPPSSNEKPLPRPTTYSLWAARRMQPFDNTNETIPWLMLSPYSPIYLCNPAQSRLFKVKVQDSEDVPLQISSARFFERWYTDVDEKMATQKPWADAFEDLLSLQQTGKMVDRDNWNTWRTPRTWFHDMASRGSLGSHWGFNEEGMLIKRADLNKTPTESPKTMREDRCARWRKNRECRRDKSSETALAQPEKQADEENVLVDKVTEALAPFPLFGSIISAADAIVSAVDQATQKEDQAHAESLKQAASAPIDVDTTVGAKKEFDTSSSTSSSYTYNSSFSSNTASHEDKPTDSVIATLTTTITRTLPDGSLETKRTLKRRFADGSKKSDESVELKRPPTMDTTTNNNKTLTTANGGLKDKETQTKMQSQGSLVPYLYPQPPSASAQNSDNESKSSRTQPEAVEEARQQHQEQELNRGEEHWARQRSQFPRRVPITDISEPEAQPKPEQKQQQKEDESGPEQQQSANRRRGGGWFWN